MLIGLIVILIFLTTLLLALSASKVSYFNSQHIFSYTKAICTPTNLCQDYEIYCENENMIKMSPITRAVVQFTYSWKNPRDEITKNRTC